MSVSPSEGFPNLDQYKDSKTLKDDTETLATLSQKTGVSPADLRRKMPMFDSDQHSDKRSTIVATQDPDVVNVLVAYAGCYRVDCKTGNVTDITGELHAAQDEQERTRKAVAQIAARYDNH